MMHPVFQKIKGKLIVSCQALDDEPLHGSDMMARMAYAAACGGAAGIRANTPADIRAIRAVVSLPIIGIYKSVYPDSEVFITPTMREIDALVEVAPDIIALDATTRPRPGGLSLETLVVAIRQRYPLQLLMADCASIEDAQYAAALGFDCVGTTLVGYTRETRNHVCPDLAMIQWLSEELSIPVIAEGGIWSPEQLRSVFDHGAFAAVVGSAITRPMVITRRFVQAITSPEAISSPEVIKTPEAISS